MLATIEREPEHSDGVIILNDVFYLNFQAAKTKQKIKEEQMQITVIERAQQIQIQEQEIIRRERELEATIRKPAEAEKYRLEKIADANRSVITCVAGFCKLDS